jgi:flagellar basal body-associated protein FliL
MRLALLALTLMFAAGPVLAADQPTKPKSFQIETVALPVIVGGKLLNYVFVSIRLDLMPDANANLVRDKEQFLRDDLVRVGHRTPFTRADDYTHLDETKIKAELARFAQTVIPQGTIKSIVITRQVSQKLLTLPSVQQQRTPEIIP